MADDPAIRAVVMTGAGSVFRGGFDLSEFERAGADDGFGRELWASSDRYHESVLHFPLPTVAAINGAALAGGFDLAGLWDIRSGGTTAPLAHPGRAFGAPGYGARAAPAAGARAARLPVRGRRSRAPPPPAVAA